MDDFKEQESWDEEAVQIEDLGAPRKGFTAFLYFCGEKWHAAVRFRPMPVILARMLCLLLLLLLPGSTLLRPVTPVSRSTSQQSITCINIIISPTVVTTWLRQVAPMEAGGVVIRTCGPAQSIGSKP